MFGLPRLTRTAALGLTSVVLLGALGSAVAIPASAAPVASKKITDKTAFKLQKKLNRLGLPWMQPDGQIGQFTRNSLCALREVLRKDDWGPNADITLNTGRAKVKEEDALKLLKRTELPPPRRYMVRGMNVNRACQIAYWVDVDDQGKKYYRDIFRVSTGSRELYVDEKTGRTDFSTKPGTYDIQWSWTGWSNSITYPLDDAECKEKGMNMVCGNLYRPIYFTSEGDALHGRTPAYENTLDWYPASHGCVRMRHKDIDKLWAAGFPDSGARVMVYGDWQG